MEKSSNGVYFGIDINDKTTMVSYYQLNMNEPNTISTVVGSEAYQIPTMIAKRRGIGQWFYGREAVGQVEVNQAYPVENLVTKAIDDETITIETDVFSARDLLALFLRRMIGAPGRFENDRQIKKLIITVPVMSVKLVETFVYVSDKLGISSDKLLVIDHKESFYYYALSQAPILFQHDVMLYDYTGDDLSFARLSRNTSTRPQIISFQEGTYDMAGRDKDTAFLSVARQDLAGKLTSTVYLIGEGFDGDWLKQSLNELCRNRRVFAGKNLYSKGACYAGPVKDGLVDWPFIYIGDNEMKLNLSLKVTDGNEMKFFTLLSAGDSWYDAVGECEVILDGSPEIEVWIQRPDSREASIQLLELTDLPERESRTSRLRITAKPTSDKSVEISIHDLGFGEIVPSSNKTWTHSIALE